MTREELNYIKDAFSQIIDDIAGNPDWHEAARAVASELGTLERKLEEKISPLPSNLDEAAEIFNREDAARMWDYEGKTEGEILEAAFKTCAEWMAGQFVLVGGEPTGWFRANDGSEYATGLDLKEPIKLPVDFYVRKKSNTL